MADPDRDATPPSAWVARFLPQAPRALPVLDLAAGGGRHARLALSLGFAVIAADVDTSGLADLADEPGATIAAVDLESGAPWPFGAGRFGAVVVANYLHRPLMPAIVGAVAAGGLLLYETFARGNEAFGRPRNPDFLLAEGELLDAVRGRLAVVAYEHGRVDRPSPRVVQRLCARRGTDEPGWLNI
jgi:SAM-dependent methyltransferase